MRKALLCIVALIASGSLLTSCSSEGRYEVLWSNEGFGAIKLDTKTGDTWRNDNLEWRPITTSKKPLNK